MTTKRRWTLDRLDTPPAGKADDALAERHMRHYRSCGCLGTSDHCCDPACCSSAKAEQETGRG